MRVQVTAVSFLSPASGREIWRRCGFVTARQRAGRATEREQHYVATVQYAYGTPSKDDRLRGRESARLQGARVPARAGGAGDGRCAWTLP